MFQTDFEKEIQEYYRSIYKALIAKETEDLASMLDDDFVLTHISGEEKSRDDLIGMVDSEEIKFWSENIERVYIDQNDDVLHVRGRSQVNVSVDGGKRRIRRIQLDLTLQKVGVDNQGKTLWRILDAKASYY